MTGRHEATGRSETVTDIIDPRPARHFQLTLDRDASMVDGDDLPPFWHYLYFNPKIRATDLGADGHEKLGRFIPDVGLPRRMWASGRVEIDRPLRLGETAQKTTTIHDITEKSGRSGRLCFVTLDHVFSVGGQHCLTETQHVVYLEQPEPGAARPRGKPAPKAEFSRLVKPDPVFLFRYSALIFYGHRIHYDLEYSKTVEGYPGLVVHGPLTATLLVELGRAQAPDREIAAIDIRAMEPLFADAPFHVEGRLVETGAELWARTPHDTTAMTVALTFKT